MKESDCLEARQILAEEIDSIYEFYDVKFEKINRERLVFGLEAAHKLEKLRGIERFGAQYG